MEPLTDMLRKNHEWAQKVQESDPSFFDRLASQQRPEYLWIGCADSRVPATQIVDVMPGEIFVHRNVANLVVHSDLNCLSVVQFAVDVLKVKHIIVCGHYGCGGVAAAYEDQRNGVVDNWLRHLRDVQERFRDRLEAIGDRNSRLNKLAELNVVNQVINVARTTIVQDAWVRQQPVAVHGWIYGVTDGRIGDLGVSLCNTAELEDVVSNGFKRLLAAETKHA
jgi:carbonic anhydrase